MSNILIGIKRFFKNKNTVTIIAVLACVAILYMFYNNRIQKATQPVPVPYATRELGPRTLITADMINTRKVPGMLVGKSVDVMRSASTIIGKYVKKDAVIPEGSLIYGSTITDNWKDIKQSLYAEIGGEYNNTLVTLAVSNESTYGNSIFTGDYIDLYFAAYEKGSNRLLFGKFIESIKVLAVIDSSGNNVFERGNNESLIPAYLVFNVPDTPEKPYYELLQKTNLLNCNLIPVPRSAEYTKNPLPTSVSSEYIRKYIEDMTVNVSSQDQNSGNGSGIGTVIQNQIPSEIIENISTEDGGEN